MELKTLRLAGLYLLHEFEDGGIAVLLGQAAACAEQQSFPDCGLYTERPHHEKNIYITEQHHCTSSKICARHCTVNIEAGPYSKGSLRLSNMKPAVKSAGHWHLF